MTKTVRMTASRQSDAPTADPYKEANLWASGAGATMCYTASNLGV